MGNYNYHLSLVSKYNRLISNKSKGNATASGNNNNEASGPINKKFNLQITTNLDTSKRTVNIDKTAANNKPHARAITGGQTNGKNNSNFVRFAIDGNGNQTRVLTSASGMPKSNTVHFMADESRHSRAAGNNNYDEYYFNEYEVEPHEFGQQQHQRGQANRQNRRPVKGLFLFYSSFNDRNVHIVGRLKFFI